MKKVYITPGCISCGTCQAICPEVFEVRDISYVIPGADIDKNENLIKEMVDICPVQVIKFEK